MTIDLGVIQLDEKLVMRQLRQDLKDDWFPDPRGFDDIFKSDQIHAVVLANFNTNSGVYQPIRPNLFNMPKANFTLRYALETGIADRALYLGLVAYLIPWFDPLLPWNVFNHRQKTEGRTSERYLFNSAIASWRDFLGNVSTSMRTNPVLLSTDLTNYYENIRLSSLQETMTSLLPRITATAPEKGQIRAHMQVLFDCLKEWCYTAEAGLPQNRDASSFLANIYMQPVDELMLRNGYQYFRYMDDIKIVCRDEFQARRALKDLSLALRERGLSVNSGKTKICGPEDKEKLAHCLDDGGAELQEIAAIWLTRSFRPISRSFPLLQKLTLKLLRERKADSRAFRFCINRLEALAHCTEFFVPDAYFSEITPLMIEALTHAPSATDRLAQYLRAVPLTTEQLDAIAAVLQDPHRATYSWQCYWLWTLFVHKKHMSESLMAHAIRVVCEGHDGANRAGAVLYSGALGKVEERRAVAMHFSKAQSFLGQRSSLIAMQELPYEDIKRHVQTHIRPDLLGVYRAIRNEAVYVAEPERASITRFIDLDRDYD